MVEPEKVKALVDLYISARRENSASDYEIADELSEIFSAKELTSIGCGEIIDAGNWDDEEDEDVRSPYDEDSYGEHESDIDSY